MSSLKITQTKSTIGCNKGQLGTMRALGLKKIGQSVQHEDNESIRGMVTTVAHLVEVSES